MSLMLLLVEMPATKVREAALRHTPLTVRELAGYALAVNDDPEHCAKYAREAIAELEVQLPNAEGKARDWIIGSLTRLRQIVISNTAPAWWPDMDKEEVHQSQPSEQS
jgi:hypothetical protein